MSQCQQKEKGRGRPIVDFTMILFASALVAMKVIDFATVTVGHLGSYYPLILPLTGLIPTLYIPHAIGKEKTEAKHPLISSLYLPRPWVAMLLIDFTIAGIGHLRMIILHPEEKEKTVCWMSTWGCARTDFAQLFAQLCSTDVSHPRHQIKKPRQPLP